MLVRYVKCLAYTNIAKNIFSSYIIIIIIIIIVCKSFWSYSLC